MAAEACRLHPDAAATDDALLFAMRSRWARLARDAQSLSRSFAVRISEVLADTRARMYAATRGFDIGRWIAELAEEASRFSEDLGRAVDFYEQHPLHVVVQQALFRNAMHLLVETQEHGNQIVAELLANDIGKDAEFLDAVGEAVVQAPHLSREQKEELCDGITALREERYAPATRLLMGGLESAIWARAASDGVIDDDRRLLKSAATGRPKLRVAKSVNNLLDERLGMELRSDLRLFLHAQLFDGHGHDLRHGRTHARVEEYAVWALVGVCGWLDRNGDCRFMSEIGHRIDDALAAQPA